MSETSAVQIFRSHLSEDDYEASATAQSLEELVSVAENLEPYRTEIDSILDLGCGYGGLTAAFAEYLDADISHGIDLDPDRRSVAENRGIRTYEIDLESEPFPISDGDIDLVLSFGVLEHLKYYDNAMQEAHRVLRDDGFVIYSVPNLGSWINRVNLLLGNQPRDVEISQERAFGISRLYPTNSSLNHVHSPTLGAFTEMLEYYGIEVLEVRGLFPYQVNAIVKVIDQATSPFPSLCRRVVVIGQK